MAGEAEIQSVAGGEHPRKRFLQLLDEALAEPARRGDLERQIEAEFTQQRAVLVADLDSFTVSTVEHGIVAFLLLLRQVQRLARPIFERHGGRMLKPEADTLFGLFESVEGAVNAALELRRELGQGAIQFASGTPVSLAVGIGWGDLLNVADEDAMGAEVNFAYKLGEEAGRSGEILLTEAARARLHLPADRFEERTAQFSGLLLRHYALQ